MEESQDQDNIDRGPPVGVPGAARIMRPKTTLETPLSPQERAKYDALLGPAAQPGKAAASKGAGNAKTALIVDDDSQMRHLLSLILTSLGFKVTECGSGTQALKTLVRQTMRLIVVDLKLPGMDGFEVIRGVRSYLGITQVPIFVISGFREIKNEITALNLGANGFLYKPFTQEKFAAYIKSLQRGTAAPGPPPQSPPA